MIRDFMESHPDLAFDAVYQGLYTYRNTSKTDHGGSGGKHGKNSADKSAEDVLEDRGGNTDLTR